MSSPFHDFRQSLAYSHSREAMWQAIYAQVFGENAHVESVPDGHALQRRGIDRWVTDPVTDWPIAVEEKLRSVDYEDVALEYLSNSKTAAPGWIARANQSTDVLLYALPSRVLVLPWTTLRKAWLVHRDEWRSRFPDVVAQNRGYVSRSVAVPIPELLRVVPGARQLLTPQVDSCRTPT